MHQLENGMTRGVIRGIINANFTTLDQEKIEASAVLKKNNTTPYTPTESYHPATLSYVLEVRDSYKAIYDPQNIAKDSFARANHTGQLSPSIITQDSNNRFVTDALITTWNAAEPAFGKLTAFNKNFGSGAEDVARGNHTHLKADVGLPLVDNTSDAQKPVSTAQQAALDLKADQTAVDLKADQTAVDLKANQTAVDLKRDITDRKFGGSLNYTEFEADGHLVLKGDATVWADINLDPTNLTGNGTDPGLISLGSTGLSIAGFAGNATEEVQGCFEFPHAGKLHGVDGQTSLMTFHCHIVPTDTAGGNVRLGLEFIISDSSTPIGTSTILYVTETLGTSAWIRQSVSFNTVFAPTEFGSHVHFRFFRLGADALDTSSVDLGVMTIGCHYEIDSIGSREATSK